MANHGDEGLKRRDFLKRASGAAAAIVGTGLLASCGGSDSGSTDLSAADVPAEVPVEVVPETQDTQTDIAPAAKATVHVATGTALTEVYAMGLKAVEAMGITGTALAGKTVFVKPNFVALGMEMFGCGFDANTGEVAKPELVVAVAEQCLKAGAAKVSIGDAAQTDEWDWTTVKFMTGNQIGAATDLQAAVDQLNTTYGAGKVELLCLNHVDQWTQIPSASTHVNLKDGIYTAKAFTDADHAFSVAVIKTHVFAKMTASMKNFFGCTSLVHHGTGFSRCKLHTGYESETVHGVAMAGVSGAFIDICKWRKDQGKKDYAVIDGTVCLEGSGPHKAPVNDGRTIQMKDRNKGGKYFVLACDDLVAADYTVAKIVNIAAADIKALAMAKNIALGETESIGLSGAALEDLVIADWLAPTITPESFFDPIC